MRKTIQLLAVILIAVSLTIIALAALPVAAQNTTVYFEQGGGKLVAASSGEIEVQSGGTLDIQSGAVVTLANVVRLTDEFVTPAQSTLTVTGSETITPAGFFQPITASLAVTPGAIATGVDGQQVLLVNLSSNAVTLSDTTGLDVGGTLALGQYDAAWLIYISSISTWIRANSANN